MRDFYDIYALVNSGHEIDISLLGAATNATMEVRESVSSWGRSDEVIELLENSEMMKSRWSRYQAANPYAESISWEEVLVSFNDVISEIKATARS